MKLDRWALVPIVILLFVGVAIVFGVGYSVHERSTRIPSEDRQWGNIYSCADCSWSGRTTEMTVVKDSFLFYQDGDVSLYCPQCGAYMGWADPDWVDCS